MTNIKYLLSDLDGVIRHYPSERNTEIEQKYRLPSGVLLSAAFEKSLLSKAVCGLISDENWRAAIINSLSKTFPADVATQAVSEWSNFPGVVDSQFLKYVETKFSEVPIAVLTNGTSRLTVDLAKISLKDKFFRIFNSADIGFCKPDRRIFAHVLENLNCQPSEILFVDDSKSHINAAQEMGIRTHHYRSFEGFQSTFGGQ